MRHHMIIRVIGGTALLLLGLGSEASALRHHRPADRISCAQVRYYVARYSAQLAEMYARSHGASEAQISLARRCLATEVATELGQAPPYPE